MTRAQHRNEAICAGIYALTKSAPVHQLRSGPPLRVFSSGNLHLSRSEADGMILLDAWMPGGKVAAFRVTPDGSEIETVNLKVRDLPKWLPILEFEAAALSTP